MVLIVQADRFASDNRYETNYVFLSKCRTSSINSSNIKTLNEQNDEEIVNTYSEEKKTCQGYRFEMFVLWNRSISFLSKGANGSHQELVMWNLFLLKYVKLFPRGESAPPWEVFRI